LKGDALVTEQDPKALAGDVVDHPLGDQEIGEFRQTPGRERQTVLDRLGLRDLLDSRCSGRLNVRGRPPAYFGYSESNPSALKLCRTSRTDPRW
jgi:hypothetical protein